MSRALILSFALLAACDGCGDAGASVDGETPYIRCMAGDAPEARQASVGGVQIAVEEGVASLSGTGETFRLGAFAGAGDEPDVARSAVQALAALGVKFVIVLGGLGTTEDAAAANLRAIASAEVPALVVVGGADEASAVDDALRGLDGDARARLLDGRRLHAVVAGGQAFIPVSGAPEGRYARTEGACGFSTADLEARAAALDGLGASRRWLVSWAAPAAEGAHSVARGAGRLRRSARRAGRNLCVAARSDVLARVGRRERPRRE